jgi:CheY-like chemotaxis protein
MSQRTILVIDDDDDLREAICVVLEEVGYATVPLSSGESALEYLRHADPPDLIVLDLVMPGVDGWRVREELRRRLAGVPIVVATGSRAIDRYPTDVATILLKPFSSRDLLDAVARFLPAP